MPAYWNLSSREISSEKWPHFCSFDFKSTWIGMSLCYCSVAYAFFSNILNSVYRGSHICALPILAHCDHT